jgi:hypothetical protein
MKKSIHDLPTKIEKFIDDKRVVVFFLVFIFAVSFLGRWFLLTKFPAMYGWDAFTRLWASDALFVRHWLPVPQIPIVVAHYFDFGLLFVRLSSAMFGSIAVVSFGIVAGRYYGLKAGMVTGLLLCVMSDFVRYTIVPYQEGPLLAFMGLYLVFAPFGIGECSTKRYLLAVFFLGLACLSRYEAWVFMLLENGRYLIGRRWTPVVKMLPVVLLLPAWFLLSSYITPGDCPPLQSEVIIPPVMQIFSNSHFSEKFLLIFFKVIFGIFQELGLGIILLPVGMAYAFLNGGRFGREILLLWFVIFGLALVRGFHSHGVVTDRMLVVLSFLGVIYVVLGIIACCRFFENNLYLLGKFSVFAVVGVSIGCGVIRSYTSIASISAQFYPEYLASQQLETCEKKSTILINYRQTQNILNESVVGAIFANSFGVLDHRETRFTFWPDQPERQPDYVLKWTPDGYHLLRNIEMFSGRNK